MTLSITYSGPCDGLGRPGLGHGLDDDAVKAGMFFLSDVFEVDMQSLQK